MGFSRDTFYRYQAVRDVGYLGSQDTFCGYHQGRWVVVSRGVVSANASITPPCMSFTRQRSGASYTALWRSFRLVWISGWSTITRRGVIKVKCVTAGRLCKDFLTGKNYRRRRADSFTHETGENLKTEKTVRASLNYSRLTSCTSPLTAFNSSDRTGYSRPLCGIIMQKDTKKMWLILALLSAVFAALTSILAKVGIEGVDSNLGTAIRTLVVFFMACGMVCITGVKVDLTEISTKTWVFLVLSGLATGASWLCYFKALQIGDVSKVAPIDKTSIIFTIVMAIVFLHEQLTLKVAIGGAFIAVGTLIMAL